MVGVGPIVAVPVLIGVVPLRGLERKGVSVAHRVGKPRFVAVQTSRVRVGIRIAVRIHAPVAVRRGIPTTVLTVVALKPIEIVAVAVVVRVKPLRNFARERICTVLDPPTAVGVRPPISIRVRATGAIVCGGPNKVNTVVLGVLESVFVRISIGLVDGWREGVVKAVVAVGVLPLDLEYDFTSG